MKPALNFRAVSLTLLIGLSVSYVLCIAGGLIFDWRMYESWAPLLPGFTWPLTIGGFLAGLLWIGGYSLYFAALIVFPYNYFNQWSRYGQ
ncbi:MAG: hypothetical protein ACE5E7_18570 [Anaerolineae bacterium]